MQQCQDSKRKLVSTLSSSYFVIGVKQTTLNFGSKFRPIGDLKKILGGHPNFRFFLDVLANGMDYRLTKELSEDQRLAEVVDVMKKGNHQPVQDDSEAVAAELLAKAVQHGFLLPVCGMLGMGVKG